MMEAMMMVRRRNVREFWLVIFSHATTLPALPLSMSTMMKMWRTRRMRRRRM